MDARTPDDERLGRLMHAAQAGDSPAYRELLEAITPRVRQMVGRRRRGAGRSEIEDLVQDVLLSVHVARASYDPGRPFLPWLMAILRHRLADGARRHARRAAHEVQVENLEVTFSESAANTSSGAPEDLSTLREAIGTLPRGQREAIELLKLRELSLKDASAATGTSVGALKVATHRAMTTLRRLLAVRHPHGD